MIIAATGDLHLPRTKFEEFVFAIDRLTVKPDLFLIVGDMVQRGDIKEYEKICNVFFGKIFCPIVACFGNNEFQQLRNDLKKKYPSIRFLDDQITIFSIGKIAVGIYGTTGSLDTPTPWQKANIPNIEKIYQQRINFADRALQRMPAQFKILLTHYAPTYKTLEGENPRFYSSLGCQVFENVILKQKPNLVLHGHGHYGTKMAWVDTVPVFNVAFLLNREIVVIDTENLKPGLAKFV